MAALTSGNVSFSSSEEGMEQLVSELHEDTPRISTAAKNVFTVLLATVHAGTISPASVSEEEARVSHTQHARSSQIFSPAHLQLSAKRVLVGIRAALAELPEPITWSTQNPQGGDQTAVERLDEINRYKVAFLLKSRVEKNKKAKVTSLFGQKLLRWTQCWMRAREIIIADNNDSSKIPKVPAPVLSQFLYIFAASLGYEKNISLQDSCDKYIDLVWAQDFAGKLAEFQSERMSAAKERILNDGIPSLETKISDSTEGPIKTLSTNNLKGSAGFVDSTPERRDLNQYWYSRKTISVLLSECKNTIESGGRVAFISTPSLYFSLPENMRAGSCVFDIDEQWSNDEGFHRFDYNVETESQLPAKLHHKFQLVVIDPPFVTQQVWELYAAAARWLVDPHNCKFLCSTIMENSALMQELLGCTTQLFRPSIPNLVYQYSLYANYESEALNQLNPEIDATPWIHHAKEARENTRNYQKAADGNTVSTGEKHARLNGHRQSSKDLDWKSLTIIDDSAQQNTALSSEVQLLVSFRSKLGVLKTSASELSKVLRNLSTRVSTQTKVQEVCATCIDLTEATSKTISDVEAWFMEQKDEIHAAVTLAGGIPRDVQISDHCIDFRNLVSRARQIALEHAKKSSVEHAEGSLSVKLGKDACRTFMVMLKRATSAVFRKQGTVLSFVKALKKL